MPMLTAPANLRCEYAVNPLGLDAARPRVSWEVQDPRRGARQTAYQVRAAGTREALAAAGAAPLWDSGQVASEQSIHVPYGGPALGPRQRVWWTVRTWDHAGQPSPWSEPAWFEMGLLARSDWHGQWIGGTLVGGPRVTAPCPYLRRAFTVSQPVVRARLYATALGLYQCQLNGQSVGDDVFPPGWTNYHKRVQYQTYDVTALVRQGDNALGAVLGDGWYCGQVEARDRQQYGAQPRFLAQLVLDLADGSTQTLATDGAWKVTTGPLLAADLIGGESYDARRELPGWSSPGYDDAAWSAAEVLADPGLMITARRGPAVRRIQELRPVAITEAPGWPPNRWVFDFGQNLVGRVRLRVNPATVGAGKTLALRHAEVLDKDGRLYVDNLRSAKATDYYTTRLATANPTGAEEVYEPTFTSHGFRYVELVGHPGKPAPEAVTAIVLHSDTPPTGTFECSDPLINQLQHNITWGQKGNFLEVPTDCPQRDERLGWTGDAQVFVRTACFNMEVAGFFTRWLRDMEDDQGPKGEVPAVIPNATFGPSDGGPAWADAAIICPWTVYLCYGDTGLLEERYGMMSRFVAGLETAAKDGIRAYRGCGWEGFGDWLALDGGLGNFTGRTPRELIGTAFLAYAATLMQRIAAALGKADDSQRYCDLFERTRAAFQRRFVTGDGLVAAQTQTAYVLALYFDLLPQDKRAVAIEELARDITERGTRLATGFVGTPYLNHVLTAGGRVDVAYALLHQKACPSWLYPVTQGATTIWERWDGWTQDKGFQDPGMNSFNHYAYGAIGAWLYASVAGLDADPAPGQTGYKHIVIRPQPAPQHSKLTHAKATLKSMYGLIESGWRVDGGTLRIDLTIPANTRATVHVPAADVNAVTESGRAAAEAEGVRFTGLADGAAVFEVGAGRYAFVSRIG